MDFNFRTAGFLTSALHGFILAKHKQYNRSTDLIYYDVTNYYFEIDQNDEFRKKGICKSHTPNPIVQMGLAIDDQGFPISYKLFEGNTHNSQTLMKILSNIKSKFNTKRVIVVADKGLNSGDNIAFNTTLGDGYIYGQKVKGSSKDLQEYALDQKGYRWVGTDEKFKIKSRVIPTTINVTVGKNKNGTNKKKKVSIDQKQVIFYSKKYAERSKKKREEALKKAADMIANPSKYTKATNYGAANYVLNIEFDKETGEYKENGKILTLDEEKIKQEEKFDGYYAIISSELDETDECIVEHYHGLWKIEESFKVTKSYLDARPVFLTLEEHINAHFFICFIALLFTRIVEKRLGYKHSVENILNSLRETTCSHLDANLYLFDYIDDVSDDINKAFGLEIGKKVMTLKEIKNIFAKVKKR
jgi:transposase